MGSHGGKGSTGSVSIFAAAKKGPGNSRSFFIGAVFKLCSRSCLVSQAFYFVMRSLNTGRLSANDLSDILRQIASNRLLVAFLGTVLSGLNRFEDRLIAAAKTDFGVDPGSAR
jgi:hypothetical protein